jgi:hypothetical protein
VERVLSRRELNRAVLARQLLLERARDALPRALERIGGIQSQYAPSMYVGLWSRLQGFTRQQLTSALERRAVVQGTLMRATIHLVSRRDYWPLALAVRDARREWWLRVMRGGPSAQEMAGMARALRPRLAAGPLRRPQILEIVGKRGVAYIGLWLDLVRAPPSGTWEERRADLYASAEDWIGKATVTAEEGIAHLVRRYLAAFGPSPRASIANWAGLPKAEIDSALERMRLVRFRSEEGEQLIDLPGGAIPPPDLPAPVRFLPTWDATLLVHTRHAGILAEEDRPRIFNSKNPHSLATFLVDGTVAGAWRHERSRITLQPFRKLDRATTRAVRDEADRLAAFHA